MQICNREPCRWGAGEVTTAFLPKHAEQIKASSLEEVVIARLEESKKQTKTNTVEWRVKDQLLQSFIYC